MGDAFSKIYGGDGYGYITIPPIRMVNWTADKTAACVLFRNNETCIHFLFYLLIFSFTPISKIRIPSPLRQCMPPKFPSRWRHCP